MEGCSTGTGPATIQPRFTEAVTAQEVQGKTKPAMTVPAQLMVNGELGVPTLHALSPVAAACKIGQGSVTGLLQIMEALTVWALQRSPLPVALAHALSMEAGQPGLTGVHALSPVEE